MNDVVKRILKGVGAFIVFAILVVIGYLAYVFLTYSRIEDNQTIETVNPVQLENVKTNTEYTIVSYNIGFGAYSDDYSFFMDGGKYSRAFSEEAVNTNVDGAISIVDGYSPDFTLFQEVDVDSTRSYHVNLAEKIKNAYKDQSNSYAYNYHSAYLCYPVNEPHGKSNSGLLTLSKFNNESAIRRSLPISTDVTKIVDLDRCYVKNYLPTEDGHYLVLINVHLSAYTSDESIVKGQIEMLAGDIKEEYDKGNYIVCGGDFNQDLLGNSPEVFHTENTEANWAKPFPKDLLSEEFGFACDTLSAEEIAVITPSCRNADSPYVEGESFVTMVDGFIVSDNVRINSFDVVNAGFKYSDHNPIVMTFELVK